MSIRHIAVGRTALVSGLMVANTLLFTPSAASAAGFFEQLFGAPASQTQAPLPSIQFDQSQPAPGDAAPVELRRAKRVADQERPVLQKPTDLMHDKTLRAGDPVMMKDGIHIYAGPEAGHHNTRQFVALDQAHVAPKARMALVAMDMTGHDPIDYAPLREGRSVSEGTNALSSDLPISVGYKITDASGKSVRYVGP